MSGQTTPTENVVMVLGKKVEADGSVPSELRLQMTLAVNLLCSGEATLIVITGGVTRPGFPSEAETALLLVPPYLRNRVLLEKKSKSTRENVIFTKELLQDVQVGKIIVVSSPAHTRRTRLLFKRIWPEVLPNLSFDSVGTSSLFQQFLHTVFYLITVIDPNETYFFPIMRKLHRGG